MIKRLFLALLLLPILCGFNGNMQGGFDGKMGGSRELGAKIAAMPPGLTFYADYTDGRNGINADWSLGDGTGYYSGLSKQPDLKGGYHATTANDDVLKYKTDRNRTAAQETIIIKFTVLESSFSNDGIGRAFLDSDTKRRLIRKESASGVITSYPNQSDNVTVLKATTTTPLQNVTYILTFSCNQSTPYYAAHVNGIQEGTTGTTVWTPIAWGASFYVGSITIGTSQPNIVYHSIAFFNRDLTPNEILAANGIM